MGDLIHFKVTGVVQGVSFRYATQKEGNRLGLRGWVRNNPDESVEGAAAGPTPKIDEFRTFLSKGPSAAKVENVEYYKDVTGADGNEINKYMGSREVKGFEVR